jgi:rSAM/selenodomain-associated transferase 1
MLQQGNDLGERMENAFNEGFATGFKHIFIIGSDLYDLSARDLEDAFRSLEKYEYVLGPASVGGYYLLGMNTLNKRVFRNKPWGGKTVLKETLADLSDTRVCLLDTRNDVDVYDDIKDLEVFKPYIKPLENEK